MIEDLIKDIKAALYERLSSPLVFSFVISWLIWNWKIVVVLLSGMTVLDKLTFISSNFSGWKGGVYVTLLPLLTAMFYVVVFPFVDLFFFRIWKQHQKSIRDAQLAIDKDQLLTLEESRLMHEKLADVDEKINATVRARDEEISTLKSQVDELVRVNNELNSRLKVYETQAQSTLMRMSTFMGKNEGLVFRILQDLVEDGTMSLELIRSRRVNPDDPVSIGKFSSVIETLKSFSCIAVNAGEVNILPQGQQLFVEIAEKNGVSEVGSDNESSVA